MSLLGAHRAEGGELTRDRVIWIALHAFEGAVERWGCRLAGGRALTDRELEAAVVQEMGGPVEECDEMTTLGFWLGGAGFSFDCRGPSIEMMEWAPSGFAAPKLRTRRIGRAAVLSGARRLMRIPTAPVAESIVCDAAEGIQLRLL